MRITKAHCVERAASLCRARHFDPANGTAQLIPVHQQTFTRSDVEIIIRRAIDYGAYRELERLSQPTD